VARRGPKIMNFAMSRKSAAPNPGSSEIFLHCIDLMSLQFSTINS